MNSLTCFRFQGLCLWLWILIPAAGLAQTDSAYIGGYEQKLRVKGFLYGDLMSLALNEGEDQTLDYVPNNPMNIGIGFTYKGFPLEIEIGHDLGGKLEEKYLETQHFDLQLHNYGRKFATDVFLQKYRGLYIDDPDLSPEEANSPDISIFQASLVGQYVFNWKKFSYQAAFSQSERQLKSVGSFLLGTGIYYVRMNSDSSFVFRGHSNIKSFQWGVNGGYAYNWVLKKYWLICGSLTMGINLGNDEVEAFFSRSLRASPSMLTRVSAYYNRVHWSLGLSLVANLTTLEYSSDSSVDFSSGRFSLTYVQRVDLPG